MTRAQLKSIVKECLVEILSEGLQLQQRAQVPVQQKVESKRPRPTALDAIRVAAKPSLEPSLAQFIKSETRGNDVMASILADTANTTLLEQQEGRHATVLAGADAATLAVATKELDEVFDENTMSVWETLAFATPGSR